MVTCGTLDQAVGVKPWLCYVLGKDTLSLPSQCLSPPRDILNECLFSELLAGNCGPLRVVKTKTSINISHLHVPYIVPYIIILYLYTVNK